MRQKISTFNKASRKNLIGDCKLAWEEKSTHFWGVMHITEHA
jgi:hypothetical protein